MLALLTELQLTSIDFRVFAVAVTVGEEGVASVAPETSMVSVWVAVAPLASVTVRVRESADVTVVAVTLMLPSVASKVRPSGSEPLRE